MLAEDIGLLEGIVAESCNDHDIRKTASRDPNRRPKSFAWHVETHPMRFSGSPSVDGEQHRTMETGLSQNPTEDEPINSTIK